MEAIVLYLYCLGSLGDLIISLSPTLSSPAARSSGRLTGFASSAGAPAWVAPGDSAAGAFLDLFFWGILSGDGGTSAPLADSETRAQTT